LGKGTVADDTERGPGRAARAFRGALFYLLLWAVACAVLFPAHERVFEGQLNSDEPEWIAISVLHWNQLVHGGPPAGAEERPESPAGPWQRGVQATTFGYMNPCLPKLLWGGLFALAGHTQVSPEVFKVGSRGSEERQTAAKEALLPLMPLARRSVIVLAALSGALVFGVARASVPGGLGWLAGGVAMALWLVSPLVLRWASYIRTDHFMMPALLGLWWWTLSRRDQLAGARGLAAALWAGLGAGILGGLATSGKLNGALGLVGCGAGVLAHWVVLPRPRPAPGRALAALFLAGWTAFGTFVALNPRLWSGPFEGSADILARWDKLMSYFQNEWAPYTWTEAAFTTRESVALFTARPLARDEPLRYHFGLSWGWCWMVLGLGALLLAAWGRGPLAARTGGAGQGAAAVSLAFALVLVLATALWLPIDWERLFLPAVPPFALLGAFLAATLAALRPSPRLDP
jgi:hypothetical protein